MANETGLDSAGVSTALPAWLRVRCLKARYASQKIWGNCFNGMEGDEGINGKLSTSGDRVTLQIMPSLSTTDISTTDGSFTNTEVVLTPKSIIANLWKNVSMDLVDITDFQAVVKWESEFAEGAGKAIGQKQDDDVAALFNDLTSNVDNSGGAFSDPKVLAAQTMLDDREVPKEDRTWVISPGSHAALLGNDKFTLANTTGFSKGVQVADGRVVGLYGTPVVVTSRIPTTNSLKDNCLFHKEAFGIVMQKDFKLEKFARVRYSTNYAGSALYGVAVLRDDHAVWVQTAV